MQAGSKLEATNLRTAMPLTKYCGYTESYSPPSAAGRTEIVSNTIDSIELSFTDKFRNPLLSLENFVVTSERLAKLDVRSCGFARCFCGDAKQFYGTNAQHDVHRRHTA